MCSLKVTLLVNRELLVIYSHRQCSEWNSQAKEQRKKKLEKRKRKKRKLWKSKKKKSKTKKKGGGVFKWVCRKAAWHWNRHAPSHNSRDINFSTLCLSPLPSLFLSFLLFFLSICSATAPGLFTFSHSISSLLLPFLIVPSSSSSLPFSNYGTKDYLSCFNPSSLFSSLYHDCWNLLLAFIDLPFPHSSPIWGGGSLSVSLCWPCMSGPCLGTESQDHRVTLLKKNLKGSESVAIWQSIERTAPCAQTGTHNTDTQCEGMDCVPRGWWTRPPLTLISHEELILFTKLLGSPQITALTTWIGA